MSDTNVLEESPKEILEQHEFVHFVRDASFDGQTVLEVQFNTQVLPRAIRKSEKYRVGDVWVGIYPSWFLRKFAGEFAMRHGIGNSAIAAEIWVTE